MGIVDPDRAVDQPAEFRIAGSRLELHQQAVSRRTPSSGHGVGGPSCRRMGVSQPLVTGGWLGLQRSAWLDPGRGGEGADGSPVEAAGSPGSARVRSPHRHLARPTVVARRAIRKQRRRHAFIASTRHWQSLLPSGAAIDERPQQREVVGEIFEHALEIPLQPGRPRPRLASCAIAPRGELPRHHLLNGLAIGEVGGATCAAPNEVVLAERQTRRQIGRLNQSRDAPGTCAAPAQASPIRA